MLDVGNFVVVGEQAAKNVLHDEGDGHAIGDQGVGRRESALQFHRDVTLDLDFTGEVERIAFAVDRVLRQAVEGGHGDEKRGQLRMIDHLEVQFFFGRTGDEGEIEGDHGGRRAEFAGDSGEVVARDGADRPADVYDFGGGEGGGERSHHGAAGHGHLDIAEVQERVAAQEDAIVPDGRDGTSGVDGHVAADKDHACHFTRGEVRV